MPTSAAGERRGDARYQVIGEKTVSLTFDPKDHREPSQTFRGQLLDLSPQGARFSVPVALPISRSLRVQLSIPELALELYVSAHVCWTKPHEQTGWQIGCVLNPEIPPEFLHRLAVGGRLERRTADRYQESLQLEARKELPTRGQPVTLQDYSEGGFCILAARPGRPGEGIHLCTDHPEPLVIVAQIQWQLILLRRIGIAQTGQFVLTAVQNCGAGRPNFAALGK